MGWLDLRNSRICSWLRLSAFCMRTCTRPRHAYPIVPVFMLILHWKPPRPLPHVHAHLALDNSRALRTLLNVCLRAIMRSARCLSALDHHERERSGQNGPSACTTSSRLELPRSDKYPVIGRVKSHIARALRRLHGFGHTILVDGILMNHSERPVRIRSEG